ncbi:S-adenosylmethionine synthase [Streptomyces rimosus subsp. rimosus]
MSRRLFTSESVTEGHPDKIADQISDTILDALLKEDPASRVAVETLITTGLVHVAGEVTTKAYADIPNLVRNKVLEIGYDSSKKGFDGASCGVSVSIGAQSPDIAQGVDTAYEKRVEGDEDELDKQGAGDQGLMFGYACDETPELMPLPIHLAHRLSRRLSEVLKNGTIPYLRPDGKTQVTIEYDGHKAVRLDTVVVSSQHASDIDPAGTMVRTSRGGPVTGSAVVAFWGSRTVAMWPPVSGPVRSGRRGQHTAPAPAHRPCMQEAQAVCGVCKNRRRRAAVPVR